MKALYEEASSLLNIFVSYFTQIDLQLAFWKSICIFPLHSCVLIFLNYHLKFVSL